MPRLRLLLAALALSACSAPPAVPDAGEMPFFEDGFVVPDDSIPCTPSDGGPAQLDCNHHGSSVAELKDGTVAISWFHGIAEKSPDSRILWSRKTAGTAWSAPEILYDDPALSEGNSTLWVQENGDLILFFVNVVGNGWAEARMRLIRSTDNGKTWSAPTTLHDENCWMLRYPPVRLKSGELFLPAYYECLALPVFVRSKDDFATWKVEEKWKEGNWLLDHVGAIQPSLVRLANDDLSMICRDGTQRHRITRSTSGPDGKTWTPGVALALPNPGAAAAQVRLANGHVVVIFDNSPTARSPIAAALSEDDGQTFVAIRTIRAGDCADDECSYPAVTQAKDGSIWVSYTHNRKTIGWAHFNEAWVRAGTDVANITCLLDETCRDGQCYRACSATTACPGAATCVDGACRTACDGGLCVGKVLARCE